MKLQMFFVGIQYLNNGYYLQNRFVYPPDIDLQFVPQCNKFYNFYLSGIYSQSITINISLNNNHIFYKRQ